MIPRMISGIRPVSPATDMIKNMVVSALFAGFATGLIVALMHTLLLEHIILEAELYETGQLVHFADVSREMPDVEIAYDFARIGLSFVASVAVYIAFALMMVAAYAAANTRGITVSVRQGILWGLAGFASFQLFPSIGLAPELPGMYAAELVARQIWWVGTVLATALGIAALSFGKTRVFWAVGIVLLIVPHIIGAPHPDAVGGVVPPELAAEFASRSLGVGAVAWAILGMITAYFWAAENKA